MSIFKFAPAASSRESVRLFPRTAAFLHHVTNICIYGAIIFIPVVFSTISFDVLEFSKQSVLAFLIVVGIVAWFGRALAEKRLSLSRSWLHMAVLLFGVGYLIISLFSRDHYLSFVGMFGQVAWSFSTIAALLLFYFLVVNRIRTVTQVYHAIFAFLLSSLVVGLYGLLQLFGVFIFSSQFTQIPSFNSVGSAFSLAIYLAAALVISSTLVFHGCRDRTCLLAGDSTDGRVARFIVWATGIVSLTYLILIDFWVAWVALLFGTILVVGIGYWRERKIGHPARLATPVILVFLAILFLVLPNPFHFNISGEVAPSASASWDIARQTLEAHPLFGSGPGTWIFDYAQYRVPAVNQSPFWAIRFDRGLSAFLTLLATIGIVGIALWVLFVVSAILKSFVHLVREKKDEVWYAYLMVFGGWATLVFAGFFYNYNVAHQFVLWLLLALLGSLVANEFLVWDGRRQASRAAFSAVSVLFVIVLVGGVSLLWLTGQRFMADVSFGRGVQAFRFNKPAAVVIQEMEHAHTLNPLYDLYTRNASQAHLIHLLNVLQGKPTQQQLADVQNEISVTVDLARLATTQGPNNVDNWSNLAQVYQGIAGFVRGADEFAIKNYQEAHRLEPQNPSYLAETGKIYLARAELQKPLLEAHDQKTQSDARKAIQENLNAAFQNLHQAIEIKSDYLPAHYFLGAVHEREGRLKEAIGELEQVLRNNNRDVGVAFELSILYYRNNEKDRAIGLLEQIVNIAPDNANARWYLALMYEERGQLDKALAMMRPLAEQLKDNTAVQQRYTSLKRAVDARSAPLVQPLPEPLKEEIRGPSENNPVKKK